MKKLHYFVLSILISGTLIITTSCEQLNLGLSESEVVEGLTEALLVGTDSSVTQASAINGYFQHTVIKVLLPDEADVVVDIVGTLPGGNLLIDELVLKLNRAAEDAANQAGPIFIDAITNITFQDAFAILQGADDAATQYLENNTSSTLYSAYKPKVESSLSSVGAQQAWEEVISLYNAVPLTTNVNTDLADHTTNKALDGLFYLVAEEEKKIRTDPIHRISDILRKVFGG